MNKSALKLTDIVSGEYLEWYSGGLFCYQIAAILGFNSMNKMSDEGADIPLVNWLALSLGEFLLLGAWLVSLRGFFLTEFSKIK